MFEQTMTEEILTCTEFVFYLFCLFYEKKVYKVQTLLITCFQ